MSNDYIELGSQASSFFLDTEEGGGVWAAEMEERERGGEGVRGERGGGGDSLAEQLILFSGSGCRLAAPVPN